MGCVTSKKDINDLHPNVFQVSNVDDLGNALSSGELEVTVSELVLHQRGKAPIRWPLKSLRRYGYDSQVFSFEAGRRCPTGSGIYAFSCHRAEQLFNFVQAHAQIRSGEDTMSRENGTPTPSGGISSGSGGGVRQPQTQDANYLEPTPALRHTLPRLSLQHNNNNNNNIINNTNNIINNNINNNGGLSRLSSVGSSNGGCQSPSSPQPAIPPPINNNYANDQIFRVGDDKCDSGCCEGSETECEALTPLYMNVMAGAGAGAGAGEEGAIDDEEGEDSRHCYANLTPGELPLDDDEMIMCSTSSPRVLRSVNYIVLDLDPPPSPTSADSPPPLPLLNNNNNNTSSKKLSQGYVTIDFDRTVALSHSVNPSYQNDSECLRKTRHNSTINAD